MVYEITTQLGLQGYQVHIYLSPTDPTTRVHTACGFPTREAARKYGEWWISDEPQQAQEE